MIDSVWRLVVDGALPGIENMAIDEALLEQTEKSDKPSTVLRFYQWVIPTLSLGNKQDADKAADLDFCRQNGIDIVRRPTGGGAVLHHLEITYSIVSNDKQFFPQKNILNTYLAISKALARGLELMGAPATIVQKDEPAAAGVDNYVKKPRPCFATTSYYELDVRGKKIIGSAQKRSKNAFLQHGSIPYQYDWLLQAGAMRSDPENLKDVMTCLADQIVPLPGYRKMVEFFVQAFAEVFQAKVLIEPLTEEELANARPLMDRFKVDY